MMKPYALSMMAGAVCASMVCRASAQQPGEGRPLQLSVGVMAVATDNRDASAGDKQENVDVFLRPRLALYAGTEALLMDLYYEPALRYRSEPGDDQDETDLQHLFGVNLHYALSERLRLRASDQFSATDDPAIMERGSVRRGDQSYIWNRFEAGLNYDLFQYSNIDLLVRNRIRRYDDDTVAALSDIDETSVGVQHRHSLTPTLRTLVSSEYRTYSYGDNHLLDRDFDSFVIAGGFENVFSAKVVGSIVAGWQTRDYSNPALDSEGKPYVRAEISGMLNPDLRVGAVAGFGLRDSDAYPYASQEYKDFRGFADHHLTPKILLRVAGTYRISTYESLGLFPGGDETTLVGDAEVVFHVADALSIMAGYRFEDVDSDAGVGASYTKNTGRIGASVQF